LRRFLNPACHLLVSQRSCAQFRYRYLTNAELFEINQAQGRL